MAREHPNDSWLSTGIGALAHQPRELLLLYIASPIARLCNWSADEPRKQERIDRGMNRLLSEWQLPFKACGQTSMLCVACCRLDHPSRYRRIENGSHHRSHHTTRVPYLDKNVTPFAYGHGYVNGIKWRDIMSYKASCDGCPRVPIWSNPTIKFKGDPAGTLDADNARVILEQAERVSKFR
jgi:hypothetical protein